ncbi:TadA family conjugal transfer-associated ATPase [Naasia sp. SYSU D00057]|uniref:TadA family conjugal transfer-associated ATPase n=1 Tax=Naasia sp. SYSU D00057 TaxID=2817380 RepID=UPI0035A85063
MLSPAPVESARHPGPDATREALWPELGMLAEYADERTTDLLLTGPVLWTDRGDGLQRRGDWPVLDEASVRELAVRLVARGGRHLDDGSPCVDVRLADGIRVHAVLPPVSATGTLVSVRLPARRRWRLGDLTAAGSLDDGTATVLLEAVRRRENILLTGGAGTGKTTLLAAILAEVPAGERIVTIEDVAELRIDHPHVVALEARQANSEGAGALGLERLVRESLRMRPDRIVLGECRGAEVRELLAALNTGHDGGAGTLHASQLADVPARLEALGALAGMSPHALARQAVSGIDLVVHLDREGGRRRVAALGRFELSADALLTVRPGVPE